MMRGGYKEPPKFLQRDRITVDTGQEPYVADCTADGSVVVLGSQKDDGGGTNAGAVYIVENNNAALTLAAELTGTLNSDGTVQGFGNVSHNNYGPTVPVAVNDAGTNVFVGVPKWKDGSGVEAGKVEIYGSSSAGWGVVQTLSNPSAEQDQDMFGAAIYLNEDRGILAIGATREESGTNETADTKPGTVYIYHSASSGWELAQTIEFPLATNIHQHSFGSTITINGSKMAIGAPWALESVYIYESGSANGWEYVQKIQETAYGYSHFGEEVQFSSDGRYLAIGQPEDRYDPAAGVYVRGGSVIVCESGSSGWAQTQLIQAPDIVDEQENGTQFGICVDFFAQQTGASTYYKLTIGQPIRQKQSTGDPNFYRGTVHVYESKQEGSEHVDFSRHQELLPESTSHARFGTGLIGSSDGKWMFVDAIRDIADGVWAAGSLYLYEWSDEY